ncbi:MAG: hypothetical protein IKR92_01180 [Alphaproteobacteria bacterium]|nr:hypothetical protein [Alphaproteobacteria bacterium]
MNCNLKNKTLVIIALLFAVTMPAKIGFAADAPSLSTAPVAETAQKAAQTAQKAEDAAQKTAEAAQKPSEVSQAEIDKVVQEAQDKVAAAEERAQKNIAAIDAEEKKAMESLKELDSEIAAVKEELQALNADLEDTNAISMANSIDKELEFLEDKRPNELTELTESMKKAQPVPGGKLPSEKAQNAPQNADNANANAGSGANANANANAPAGTNAPAGAAKPGVAPSDPFSAGAGDELSPEGAKDENAPAADASKSPLENFGNAILSKVDNSLFNKMSTIEKQTTLLRLEYKREELKNKVIALRTARLRAMQEEIERRRAYEEKLKNAEAERQAKILEEQRKLKEREMELEKLRQAKVINDYMNEMLLMNQKWIDENAKLQNRIHELEDERVALINDFKDKLGDITKYLEILKKHVIAAVQEHFITINSLRDKIADLQTVIADREEQLRACREAGEAGLAEGENLDGTGVPSQVDVDLSHEYAILDITGQGDEIVAKLVSIDGKTFTVHRGSMLKGGEIVTAITDTYILFENKGIKSYLYTGGGIREYEPEATFNDSSEDFFDPIEPVRRDNSSAKNDNKSDKQTKGTSSAPAAAPKAAPKAAPAVSKSSSSSKHSKETGFSFGMSAGK